MECYDPAANTWETLPPMFTAREAPGVVAMGGLLYAMGGYDTDSESDLSTLERFDFVEEVTNSFSPRTSLTDAYYM